jgi:hypothetical protein
MALRKGKLDESQVELDYTARELARVRVTADRAGVAVFADPNDWTGKAVSVGEKVMLLADPANVELTAYLPVADNIDVKPGATLTLYPKSSPLSAYDARIETVAYRAEPTPDGVLAYRVKAAFAERGAKAGARRDGHGAHSRTLGAARVLRAAPAANGRAAVARLVGPRACADFTELIDFAKNRAHHRCPVLPTAPGTDPDAPARRSRRRADLDAARPGREPLLPAELAGIRDVVALAARRRKRHRRDASTARPR